MLRAPREFRASREYRVSQVFQDPRELRVFRDGGGGGASSKSADAKSASESAKSASAVEEAASSAAEEAASTADSGEKEAVSGEGASITIFNSKMEIQSQMEEMAKKYSEEKGVDVEVYYSSDTVAAHLSTRYASNEPYTISMVTPRISILWQPIMRLT